MAATKRRRRKVARVSNPRRRRRSVNPRRRRRRNSTRIIVVGRRRRASNPRRRRRSNPRRRHVVRRRNPMPTLFGSNIVSSKSLKYIGGGLVGVAAAKFIPANLPVSFQLGSSQLTRVAITGASAFVAGWVASKLDGDFGNAVLFGGLMQTGSVALNTFLPSVSKSLGIGLGELMPGQFSVPQNPLRQIAAPAPVSTRTGVSGMARAYGSAY